MLDVYLCEDEQYQRDKWESIISNYILMKGLNMNIRLSAETPEPILESVKKSENRGIYFLDIDLKTEMTGLGLAEQIRKYDSRGYIIFVTTHFEMLDLTFRFKVEAYDFIIKEDFDKLQVKIVSCLDNIEEREMQDGINENKIFIFKQGGRIIQEDLNNIVSFEIFGNNHNVLLTTNKRQVQFYGSLKEVELQLDKRFIRCSDAVIVNADKITEIRKKERTVCMNNGDEYLASVRRLRNLC